MSEDAPDGDDNTATTKSFEEWLDQQAANQGISREELFERLVSSYWTLNEMMQLLEASGNRSSQRNSQSKRAVDTEAFLSESPDRTGAPATDPPRTEADVDRSRATEPSTGGNERSDAGDPIEQIEELRERVEKLQSRLDEEVERGRSLDGVTEAIANRLATVESELEELASESEAANESHKEKYESLAGRIEAIESDLDRKLDALAAEQRELATEQRQIKSWLDSEFENLETILTYLVSQTDELERDISNAESRYEEAFSRLRWERDALDSLKRDAAELNVREGECESCGARIDLGLLSRPYCPKCENTLTGVEDRKKWFVLSDPLVTTGAETGNSKESVPRKNREGNTQRRLSPESGGSRQETTGSRRSPTDGDTTDPETPSHPFGDGNRRESDTETRGVHSEQESTETDGPGLGELESMIDSGGSDPQGSDSGFEFGRSEFDADRPDPDAGEAFESPFENLDERRSDE